MSDSARERGQAVYKKLFGDQRESNPEDTALDDFTIEHLFADVWSRPNLQMRQRSMITVALLAALGRDRELARHIEGALHLGISRDEIIEIMIQVAYYSGWPAGHNGQRVAQEVFAQKSPEGGLLGAIGWFGIRTIHASEP
jgi:4-carboxymuconolactone decarboxylase